MVSEEGEGSRRKESDGRKWKGKGMEEVMVEGRGGRRKGGEGKKTKGE